MSTAPETVPMARIEIAIATTKVPLFERFMASRKPDELVGHHVVLMGHFPAKSLAEDGVPYHTILHPEAENAWEFFYLGMDWVSFQREGGLARFFTLDTHRVGELHLVEGLAVVLEHEDLMASPQYERLKPYVEEDKARGTGQRMLAVVNERGLTLPDVWNMLASGEVQFSQAPQVRVGRVRFPCGKEVQDV